VPQRVSFRDLGALSWVLTVILSNDHQPPSSTSSSEERSE
jgi:hypothetical protein